MNNQFVTGSAKLQVAERFTPQQKAWLIAGAVTLGVLAFAAAGMALAATGGGAVDGGTGGSDILQSVYNLLQSAVTGSVGKVLVLLLIVIGIAGGMFRGSLTAFALGVGAGIGLYFAPTVINAIFSATVMPHAIAASWQHVSLLAAYL